MRIGIVFEKADKVLPIGYRLVAAARRIFPADSQVDGLISLAVNESAVEINGVALDSLQIYRYQTKRLTWNHYSDSLVSYCRQYRPDVLLIGASDWGRSLASITAARLETGLTADCSALVFEKNQFYQIRPAYGGKVYAKIYSRRQPQMATVGLSVYDDPPPIDYQIDYQTHQRQMGPTGYRLIEEHLTESLQLTEDKVLIAGGAITTSAELAKIVELAKKYHSDWAVSRRLVQGRLADYSRQVGISGRSLKAKTAILFGVSGSQQTMAGLTKVERLVGLNNDSLAPIFKQVDVGLVTDWQKVVDQLLAI